jgi:hypothetical protein
VFGCTKPHLNFIYDKLFPVDRHSQAVTKHYLAAENTLDDGYWDAAWRETPYYENMSAPHPPKPEVKGRCVGEFDVLLANYEDKVAYYKEIKTNPKQMNYAEEQLERAEDHFEDTDWDVIGNTVLE